MSFEQSLRDRINKAPFRSREKDLLKVVLGEVQQKSAGGKVTDEQGLAIVKKMAKANEETLGLLGAEDKRREQYEEENAILQSLLPNYLTVEQIVQRLTEGGLADEIKTAKNEGQATGIAMKKLKADNAPVEGDTVKQAVVKLRS
jgi:hypothetical protein